MSTARTAVNGEAVGVTPQFSPNLKSRLELEPASDAVPDLNIGPVAA